MTNATIHRLTQTAPRPLALLAQRMMNGRNEFSRLQGAARFLPEATAALAGAYWLGRAQQINRVDDGVLEALALLCNRRAVFGHRARLLRAAAKAVGGESYQRLIQALAPHPALDALEEAIHTSGDFFGTRHGKICEQFSAARRQGVLGFIDFTVTIRNFVVHGAQAPGRAVRGLSAPFAQATAVVLSSPAIFEGCSMARLVQEGHSRECYWWGLVGFNEDSVKAPLPDPLPASGPEHRLYMVGPSNAVPLSFLVIHDMDDVGDSGFGFFERIVPVDPSPGAAGRISIEYLDFMKSVFNEAALVPELSDWLPRFASTEPTPVEPDQPAALEEPEGARRFGGFLIEAELGRGGMGEVFLARQLSLDRQVALKTLPSHMVGDRIAMLRFWQEVKALGRLDHPNVVHVHLSGVTDERPWYTMEYIDGADLDVVFRTLVGWQEHTPDIHSGHLSAAARSSVRARAGSAFAEPERSPSGEEEGPPRGPAPRADLERTSAEGYHRALARLFAGGARGLDAIHARNVIHRDIKPSNLMLDACATHLVVMDLGLAKRLDISRGWTRHEGATFVGSDIYAAPEQFMAAGGIDRRTDIYGLGAVLFELATLTRLYADVPEQALRDAKIYKAPPSARAVDRDVPQDLDAIIAKAMATDPRQRYQSALAMAEDLDRFVAGEPTLARPMRARDHIWYAYRSHRALVHLVAAFLVLGAGVVVFGVVRISREREVAVRERDQAEELAGVLSGKMFEALLPLGQTDLLKSANEAALNYYLSRAEDEPGARNRFAYELVRRGELELQTGEYEAAARDVREALVQLDALPPSLMEGRAAVLDRARAEILQSRLASRNDGPSALISAEAARDRLLSLQVQEPEAADVLDALADAFSALMEARLQVAPKDIAGAHEALDHELTLRQTLVSQYPESVERQAALASHYNARGYNYMRDGDPETATDALARSVAIRGVIARTHPFYALYQNQYAQSLNNLGLAYSRMAKLEIAQGFQAQAFQVAARLVQADPENTDYLWREALTLHYQADNFAALGQHEQAVATHTLAIQKKQHLLELDPAHLDCINSVAAGQDRIAVSLVELGRYQEALEYRQRALPIREQLLRDHPHHAAWRTRLITARRELAELYGETLQPEEQQEQQRLARELEAEAERSVSTEGAQVPEPLVEAQSPPQFTSSSP